MDSNADDKNKMFILGEHFVVTNKNTINHLTKIHTPTDDVQPHSTVMISLIHCDYCGVVDSVRIAELQDSRIGIVACISCHDRACKKMYEYCIENQIYPMRLKDYSFDDSKSTREKLGIPDFITVTRSNGDKENTWEIQDGIPTGMTKEGDLYMYAHERKLNIQKPVIVKDLCKNCGLDYDNVVKILREELSEYYARK